MYVPLAQSAESGAPVPPFVSVSLRAAAGPPGGLARPVVAAILNVNRDLALTVRPLADQVNASLVQERLVAVLAGGFGTIALLLAGLGLYGVTAHAVARRRHEIGIRMALGADAAGVIRLVIARIALLVGVGLIMGTGLSLWAARFVGTLLYGLEPHDPITLLGAAVALVVVAAMAAWVPARRAARIDPADVLRTTLA
jgi:ABC-type antimicrobial peptide transport system permease subunit